MGKGRNKVVATYLKWSRGKDKGIKTLQKYNKEEDVKL